MARSLWTPSAGRTLRDWRRQSNGCWTGARASPPARSSRRRVSPRPPSPPGAANAGASPRRASPLPPVLLSLHRELFVGYLETRWGDGARGQEQDEEGRGQGRVTALNG